MREVRPPVWRRVLVPGEMSLAELHEVVQVVMGWTDSHLHGTGGGQPFGLLGWGKQRRIWPTGPVL